jgi:hypothetical protein
MTHDRTELRKHFAGFALSGVLAHNPPVAGRGLEYALLAYEIADAMVDVHYRYAETDRQARIADGKNVCRPEPPRGTLKWP